MIKINRIVSLLLALSLLGALLAGCAGSSADRCVKVEGDTISIDIPNASITLEVSDAVLAERKAKYVAPEPNIKTGWLSRYARMVTSANLGAVLK